MREKSIVVYKVGELSDNAKEHAYYKWLEQQDYPWGKDNEQTLEAFAGIFPVKIYGWEYDQNRGNVNFTFTGDDEIEELKGIRLAKYIWNNYRKEIFKPKLFYKGAVSGRTKFWYSKFQLQDGGCPLTGYCVDDDILEPIYKFLKNPDKNVNFHDLMDQCFDSWINACSNDFEYCTSMEYFEEVSAINDWEYDENGRIQ